MTSTGTVAAGRCIDIGPATGTPGVLVPPLPTRYGPGATITLGSEFGSGGACRAGAH
jgi:hypothetical protein